MLENIVTKIENATLWVEKNQVLILSRTVLVLFAIVVIETLIIFL